MRRFALTFAAAGLLAGCGEVAAPDVPEPASIVLSGRVTFDSVPPVAGRGLDYAATTVRPARGVTVELLEAGLVIASTATSADGAYSFDAPAATDVALRVRAEMLRIGSPSWDFRVADNVHGDALYTLAGTVFRTGEVDTTRNLHAESGWDGASYSAPRAAAPFAILDVVYDGVELVLSAAPDAAFPPLPLYWSPENVPVAGTGVGEIGSSRYRPGLGIFLLGAAGQDTDEYDRHVIAHEWGHYLEHRFARSDSIGGAHTLSDQLDMRLAFGEAFANAFAAMVTGRPVYTDSFGAGQARTFSFDLEQSPSRRNPNPGWFNEESVQSLIYDLYDGGRDVPPETTTLDDLELGFQPIFAVLTGAQRSTRALTSVFPFLAALRAERPADQPLIDALAASQRIATVADDYGSGQTNFGLPTGRSEQDVRADFLSVYESLTVGGPAVRVCSLDDYTSALTGAVNKLASRRFVKFSTTADAPHVITARAVAPLNAAADPDLRLHVGGGQVLESSEPPQCTATTPEDCVETFAPTLSPGDYVLEVYEWTNTNDTDDAEYPPIGRTCFDVTVTL
jgi:hypothetical protein